MSRTFYKENVDIKDGKLQLTVKAGSVNGDVSSAEIFTEGESEVGRERLSQLLERH